MLRTTDLEYHLPEGLIATTPAEPRDSARMMVVRRDGQLIEHAHVRDLARFLRRGDLMVMNQTRVIPARLEGKRIDTAGRISGLFLAARTGLNNDGGRQWVVFVKARRQRPGVVLELWDHHDQACGVSIRLVERSSDEDGAWVVDVLCENEELRASSDEALLARVGRTPLPPYILAARKHAGIDVKESYDRERYQTVYAREKGGEAGPSSGEAGSVAAPTAGLHLTPELFERLERVGVSRAEVTLHVGTGTFKTVETEFVEQHAMHSEWCSMSQSVASVIRRVREGGDGNAGRVVCVGTTSARTVESYAVCDAVGWPESMSTRILITPGYPWRWTDGMLTNFHLPRSTLLAMIGSLFCGERGPDGTMSEEARAVGIARLKALYEIAVREGYRFFSYGDAMLVLP